jgi:prepilin-type N-terminal cleavage/methylation domain-containing protein
MRRLTCRAGFTLIELLVAMSLMVVAFATVGGVLVGGSRVWQRMQCGGTQETELVIAFDQMRRGLQGYRVFTPVPFDGRYDRVSFPSLVRAETEEGKEFREPGRTSFYFDRRRGTLCRSVTSYREMKRVRAEDRCEVLAENIEKFNLKYYHYDPERKSFQWNGSWQEPQPPVSVMVEIHYRDVCSREKSKKNFQISIPVGPIG